MKKTIMSCLLALGFLSASAQDQQPKTEYVFNPHWYVQIQPVDFSTRWVRLISVI